VRDQNPQGEDDGKLRDLALLFAKLGFVAFGGPAAHIAMMRAEIVGRRRWMGEQEFLDLMGASNPRLRLRRPHRAHHPPLAGFPGSGWPLGRANVASLALMAGVTWQLGRASLGEPVLALIALAALVVLFATEVNPAWLVLGGGSLGFAYHYLLG
jgi:chromate transport protein ChrA